MIDDDRAWFSAIVQSVSLPEFTNRFNQPHDLATSIERCEQFATAHYRMLRCL